MPSPPPAWAQSCANPLKAYPAKPPAQPSYPAYPGYRLASQEQWREKCLGPQAQQPGNRAFQQYAAHPGAPAAPGAGTLASTAHAHDPSYKTVCFDNPKHRGDRLCIFQSFDVGNTNVEQMDPATRAAALAALVGGVGEEMDLAPKMFCLHHGDEASVGWTHLHTFTPSGPWPDGLSPANAYCSAWRGSAAATAPALSAQVQL
jgi:hypothetical protein